MKEKIRIVEVGPRDGLQNEKKPIPLGFKGSISLKNYLHAGMEEVELTSFVRSDKIPQLGRCERINSRNCAKALGLLNKCWALVP
jgi:hydroxymethylglutaryl-CoA lyase